ATRLNSAHWSEHRVNIWLLNHPVEVRRFGNTLAAELVVRRQLLAEYRISDLILENLQEGAGHLLTLVAGVQLPRLGAIGLDLGPPHPPLPVASKSRNSEEDPFVATDPRVRLHLNPLWCPHEVGDVVTPLAEL